MAEHRTLTGDSLHEPKGADTAANGTVYVANGSGSGAWTARLDGLYNKNVAVITGLVEDLSTAAGGFYSVVPFAGNLNKVYVVLDGTLTAADAVLTIAKNGVDQTPTITVPFTGSGAGVKTVIAVSPEIAFADGDVLSVKTDGGSTGAVSGTVTAKFEVTG